MNLKELLQTAIKASEEASKEILSVYHSENFGTELKGDNSPLTVADKRAHLCIVKYLKETGLPILSEEGKDIPYEVRKNWKQFWLVDPLDGTKEFIKRNDEFTVNIALIENQQPILGVLAVPVTGVIYYAARGLGAFKKRFVPSSRFHVPSGTQPETSNLKLPACRSFSVGRKRVTRVVASRSHMNDDTKDFIAKLTHPEVISAGSSLKFMLLAEGKADIYPRFGPTMEWDTAAAHGILKELGIKVTTTDGTNELSYNKPNLLNPYFIAGSTVES
ncbi:MAG: 3'(2'),5'-bisphosphate nucleotidase CysQ [Cyclobacteriaceae bacterium]|nr:3'(2'),5'-bisphosphate nucleotidase CysQ [Cyclobacteriaceae bacterium]